MLGQSERNYLHHHYYFEIITETFLKKMALTTFFNSNSRKHTMEHQFVRHVRVLNNAGKEINNFPNGDLQIHADHQLFYKYVFPRQFLL